VPEALGAPVRDVGAQHIAAFAPARPVVPLGPRAPDEPPRRIEIAPLTDSIAQARQLDIPPCLPRPRQLAWAHPLRRGLDIAAFSCPRCSAIMVVLAFLTDPAVIIRILTYLDLPLSPPLLSCPESPSDETLFVDDQLLDDTRFPRNAHPTRASPCSKAVMVMSPRPRTSLALTAVLPRRDIGNTSLRPYVRRPDRMGLPSDTLSIRPGNPDALTGTAPPKAPRFPLIDTMRHLVYTQPDGENSRYNFLHAKFKKWLSIGPLGRGTPRRELNQ
jgi:hypothetical protein